jgi:hypothetical protein
MISLAPTDWHMNTLDREALDNVFQTWKQERMPESKESDAFEVFTAELVLKDAELSDEQISVGIAGGGGDGGVDGFFFFVDRALVQSDEVVARSASSARLDIIQSTTTPGFQETRIDKLEKFCRYLLDWEDLTDKKNLRQNTKEHMMRFRIKYAELMQNSHTLKINLHYASRSDNPPSSNLMIRVGELKAYIKSKLSLAEVEFEPWGCKRLMDAHRNVPKKKLTLPKVRDFTTSDNSVVCLCTVASYANFLDDGHGQIRTWMMEPNVRDYQGSNKVNKQIRETLNNAVWKEDFWWLNNGVTILADACSVTGDQLTIDNPEVVNGLQTSYEIFRARGNLELKKRHLLVKVIVAPDDKSKTAIIRATNSQTTVSTISLQANEPLQFAIEDELLNSGLYYDRRKGKSRQQRKPIKDVVSMKALGQAVIAAYLQLPSDARARPDGVINSEKHSASIYSEDRSVKFYRGCILIDRRANEFVQSRDLTDDLKYDFRYYVTMLATCELCGKAQPSASDITAALPNIQVVLTDTVLTWCLGTTQTFYTEYGGTDKTAKGREMENAIKASLVSRYSLNLVQ